VGDGPLPPVAGRPLGQLPVGQGGRLWVVLPGGGLRVGLPGLLVGLVHPLLAVLMSARHVFQPVTLGPRVQLRRLLRVAARVGLLPLIRGGLPWWHRHRRTGGLVQHPFRVHPRLGNHLSVMLKEILLLEPVLQFHLFILPVQ
jgi:hypothetical protein